MKKFHLPAVLTGAVLGAGLWIGIAEVTGRREAWDGDLLLYAGSLLAAGCMIGLIFPSGWILGAAGIYAGQMIVMLIKSGGDFGLLPLGLVALAIFTSVSAFGAFVCALLRKKLS